MQVRPVGLRPDVSLWPDVTPLDGQIVEATDTARTWHLANTSLHQRDFAVEVQAGCSSHRLLDVVWSLDRRLSVSGAHGAVDDRVDDGLTRLGYVEPLKQVLDTDAVVGETRRHVCARLANLASRWAMRSACHWTNSSSSQATVMGLTLTWRGNRPSCISA